jgi:hypothetical protein
MESIIHPLPLPQPKYPDEKGTRAPTWSNADALDRTGHLTLPLMPVTVVRQRKSDNRSNKSQRQNALHQLLLAHLFIQLEND